MLQQRWIFYWETRVCAIGYFEKNDHCAESRRSALPVRMPAYVQAGLKRAKRRRQSAALPPAHVGKPKARGTAAAFGDPACAHVGRSAPALPGSLLESPSAPAPSASARQGAGRGYASLLDVQRETAATSRQWGIAPASPGCKAWQRDIAPCLAGLQGPPTWPSPASLGLWRLGCGSPTVRAPCFICDTI